MKTFKSLALLAVLTVAGLANAQTLTRSLVLKPATETNTLTLASAAGITTSYSIFFPSTGSAAAAGPFVKTTVASGNKTLSFGQVDLTSNGAAGDITGILGVTNGGTGLSAIGANQMLVGAGGNTYTTIAAGTDGQVLGNVAGVPTWGTTLGSANGATVNINGGNGTTTNINSGGTGGTTNIGNATSLTNFDGTVDFTSADVTLTLTQNNIWVGDAANEAAELPPSTNSILLTDATNGGTPQWGTTLPSGLTIPGATITTPTITGGTINNTVIGGTTPAAATFTTLTSSGTTNLNTTGTGTTNIGNNAGPSTTNIAGDVNFTAPAGDVTFTNMPNLPLPENNMYVGNASNNAQAYATTAERVLTSPGGVPTWSTTLPSAVTVPFDQISSGTNTTATMTVGTGASLAPSGSGTVTANQIVGSGSTSNAVDLETAEVNGTLPIANGGTNSTTIGAAGTVTYSTGTAYASTAAGTTGQILQSNGAGAPSWVNVGNLLASASFSLTADATAETNGYFTVNTTSVPTLVSGYGYDASARVIVTLESASGPGQVVTVTNRTANSFRVYTGATTAGDIINVVIIDTTP